MKDWLKRPELLTLLIATVVTVLGTVATSVMPVPAESVGQLITVFWAIALGALVEGKFKGADYTGTWKTMLNSKKMRVGLASVIGVVLNAVLQPLGYGLEDAVVNDLLNFGIVAIGGMAGLDAYQAATTTK